MLKASPLKHKGNHGMYASEEEYHKVNGGEVEEVTDNIVKPLDLNPTLPPILSDEEKDDTWKNHPKNPVNIIKEQVANDPIIKTRKELQEAKEEDIKEIPSIYTPVLKKIEELDSVENVAENQDNKKDEIFRSYFRHFTFHSRRSYSFYVLKKITSIDII